MRKVQFGCGGFPIEGWENHDRDVDISNPLPMESVSVDVVFCEMTVEHITPHQAWNFFEECFRILKSHGLIRIVIPDFVKCWKSKDPDWLKVNQEVTHNDGSLREQFKSMLFFHGHQSLWTSELLASVLESIGFSRVCIKSPGESEYDELKGVEQHQRAVGLNPTLAESGCVEGMKV